MQRYDSERSCNPFRFRWKARVCGKSGERVPERRAPVGSGGTFSLNANIGTHLAEGCFASPSELIYEPRRLQVYRAPYAFTSGEGFRARLLQAQQAPTNAANGTSLDYVERLGRKVRMH
jgi:hypothetical protein